jgi:hypothetical protein
VGDARGGPGLRLPHGGPALGVEALRERLQSENEYLRAGAASAEGFDDVIGESPALQSVLFLVEHVAPTESTVLLLGETGTGKELIAKAIHARSSRRDRTLVKVNCAALPPTLIESELFGHEKIGELPLPLQAKLLRVLQEGEFERVGSAVSHRADVRLIAASNRNLAEAAREGTFRSDLGGPLPGGAPQAPPSRRPARGGGIEAGPAVPRRQPIDGQPAKGTADRHGLEAGLPSGGQAMDPGRDRCRTRGRVRARSYRRRSAVMYGQSSSVASAMNDAS